MERPQHGNTSGTTSSATEFWYSLALMYHQPLLRLPALCDCYGCQFSFEHAPGCRKIHTYSRTRSFVTQNNEIRDATGDLTHSCTGGGLSIYAGVSLHYRCHNRVLFYFFPLTSQNIQYLENSVLLCITV